MKLEKNTKRTLWIIMFAAVMYAIALNLSGTVSLLKLLWEAISPVVVGICIAFILNVPLRWLEYKVFRFIDNKKHTLNWLRCTVSIVVTLVLVLGLIALSFVVIIPQFIDTAKSLIANSAAFASNALEWIKKLLVEMDVSSEVIAKIQINWSSLVEKAMTIIELSAARLASFATSLTTSAFGAVFDFVLSFALALYMLASKRKIKSFLTRMVKAYFPTKTQEKVFKLGRLTNESFSNFIGGQFAEALILGMLCFVGMTIFRFPYAVVISVLMAVLALIPIVGAIVGAVLASLLILTVSPLQALLFIVFIIVLQQLEGNLIYPKVVGLSIGLPGVVILSVVVVGGELFGIPGIIIGVPLSSAVYVLIKEGITSRLTKRAKEIAQESPVAEE